MDSEANLAKMYKIHFFKPLVLCRVARMLEHISESRAIGRETRDDTHSVLLISVVNLLSPIDWPCMSLYRGGFYFV